MNKEQAISLIWDYMHMGHRLKKADIIFLLGSNDARVAHHAAKIWNEGWAPYLVISGDGMKHVDVLLKDPHGGKKEAEILKEIAVADGVPEECIITESAANNTGENFQFMTPLLQERHIKPKTAIIVQKPYMERRAYATGKVWWPDVEMILTSPSGTFTEYIADKFDPDTIINIMIGDLQRIKEYPKQGFQIEQEIPKNVWDAFEYLVSLGYTKRLI